MKNDMNWEEIEKNIKQINKIVADCEEPVKERCFELLFGLKYGNVTPTIDTPPVADEKIDALGQENRKPAYELPGNVLVLLRKNGLTEVDLEKLFMLGHEPILSIYKVDHSKMSQAQVQKTFMILLENALSTGQFRANYSEIRDTCKEEGLVDGNFTGNLKSRAEYFKGAITEKSIDSNGVVELSGLGMIKLAEIIKQLAQ